MDELYFKGFLRQHWPAAAEFLALGLAFMEEDPTPALVRNWATAMSSISKQLTALSKDSTSLEALKNLPAPA